MAAILFDLDGTLVDTIEDIRASINHIMRKKGCMELDRETTRKVVGRGLRNALKEAFFHSAYVIEEDELNRCYDDLITFYEYHAVVYSQPYENVRGLLGEVKRRGDSVGILSNKTDVIVKKIVSELFPNYKFDFVRGALKNMPLKPNRWAVEEFAKTVNSPLEEVIIVGDSEVDYETMKNVPGAKGVFVTWGFRDKCDMEASGIAPLVDNIDKLEEVLWN
ncbi:MAG: HAD family hydrolase [Sphaerochaetaceae bacterium]|nr:HAD family hydrolase [Sphaerochaetaceae bacterium]